jgi:hypothetical protein
MRDERMDIAPADRSGFVTYSRIEPRGSRDGEERQGPILTGIEVPNLDDEFGAAPDVRAEAPVAGRPRRRGMLGPIAVFALVAFAAGGGILAGSFFFPTIGKVLPIGDKAVVAGATDDKVAAPAAERTASTEPAVAPAAPAGDEAARAKTFHWPVETTSAAPPPGLDKAAIRGSAEKAAEPPPEAAAAPEAKPPVPRSRPESEIAAAPDAKPVRPPVDAAKPATPPEPSVAEAPEPQPIIPPASGPDATPDVASADAPPPMAETMGPPVADTFGPPLPEAMPPVADAAPQAPAIDESHTPPADIPQPDTYAAARASPDAGDADWPNQDPAAEDLNETYQTALDRWVVLGVRDGRAVIDGRERGVFMVEAGSEIPGVGIVEAIKRRHGRWVVVTSGGAIFSGQDVSRRRFWLLSRLLR